MNIQAKIYENLSAHERIRAAVSALARDDDAELHTLKVTCPKKTILMNDPAYSDAMPQLFKLAVFVEYVLAGVALEFLAASRSEEFEKADEAIADAASVEAAWRAFLTEMGIPWLEMSKAGPPRFHAVKVLLRVGEGEEDAETVQLYLENFRAQFET